MSMSDPIADMLTRIRNANTAKHDICPSYISEIYKHYLQSIAQSNKKLNILNRF